MPVMESHCSGSADFIFRVWYGTCYVLATGKRAAPSFNSHVGQ